LSLWSKALKTVRSVIGESVVYKGTGSLNESIKGVYSDVGMMLDLENFNKVIDQEPQVLIRLADLTQEPSQGDIFEIRGEEFYVAYLEKDGEGGAKVMLREKAD
jgi:hypothetical protein